MAILQLALVNVQHLTVLLGSEELEMILEQQIFKPVHVPYLCLDPFHLYLAYLYLVHQKDCQHL